MKTYLMEKKYWPGTMMLDILGSMLFFATKMRRMPRRKAVRNALFIRLEHIGDMVMATPVFETFKRSNPDARITVLCRELTVPIIKNNPYVDEIITYEAPWFMRRGENRISFWEMASRLRAKRFDLAFEMHGDPRNNLLAFLTGAYTVGYGCRGGGFLLNRIMDYDPKRHMIEQNLSLIKGFAGKEYKKTKVFLSTEEEKKGAGLMRRHSLNKGGFMIINPRSGRAEKDLTDREVERLIKNAEKTRVVVTGAKSEAARNRHFGRFKNVTDLTGLTDLPELIYLVRNANKVIAPDTGIIHIAKAEGTRFECIYKTTDAKTWGYE